MRIGICGAGKLGLTCGLAIESKDHEVLVYDPNPMVTETLKTKKLPYNEEGAQVLLDNTHIQNVPIEKLVEWSEMIFVAVQTPHDPKYEGITRLPVERKDFDYSVLISAVRTLSEEIERQKKYTNVIIISTVLPGTIERVIKPLLSPFVKLCYNPYFIAMTTTIRDFLDPEFILFGVDDKDALIKAKNFYRTINHAPFFECNIKEAEFLKVAYNTFISRKIEFINGLGELAHKIGGIDIDVISEGLALGYRRLMSDEYLHFGMGDGGSCHPRDNIALSFVAQKYNLSHDIFESTMIGRERQTEWLANLIVEQEAKCHLPIVIFGKAYKPETSLVNGSPSALLHSMVHEKGMKINFYDPFIEEDGSPDKYLQEPHIYFIGTKHKEFAEYDYPKGSTIIDPFRYIPQRDDIHLISIGRYKEVE